MRRNVILGGLVIIAASMVLGSTVFREDVAQAAQAILPVREQNVDADGNIKVHEQGTVAPITGGGQSGFTYVGDESVFPQPVTASALIITLSGGARELVLYQGDFLNDSLVGRFPGPPATYGANTTISLALTRPVKFDRARCLGLLGGQCEYGWIGNRP